MALVLSKNVLDIISSGIEEERKRALAAMGGVTVEQLAAIAKEVNGFAVPLLFKDEAKEVIESATRTLLGIIGQMGNQLHCTRFGFRLTDSCKSIEARALIEAARESLGIDLKSIADSGDFKFVGFLSKEHEKAAELRTIECDTTLLRSHLKDFDAIVAEKREKANEAAYDLEQMEKRIKEAAERLAANEAKIKAGTMAVDTTENDQPAEPPAKKQALRERGAWWGL